LLPFVAAPITLDGIQGSRLEIKLWTLILVRGILRWRVLQAECSDFLCGLIKVDVATRLTAQSARNHPWITGADSDAGPRRRRTSIAPTVFTPQMADRLKHFRERTKLQRA
jgi:hypothetical protein